MVKHTGDKSAKEGKSKKKVLITQPRPESDKSPYFELGRKFEVELPPNNRGCAFSITTRHSILLPVIFCIPIRLF